MILQLAMRCTGFMVFNFCVALSLTAAVFGAGREDLDDLSARIQFDYYAADASALQRDLQALKQLEALEPTAILRQYYLAYGQMRLAETLGDKDRSLAHKAASNCVDMAEVVTGKDRETKHISASERERLDTLYGELWAIQATCATLEIELGLLTGMSTSLGARSGADARKQAASIAPNNSRVQLLAAIHLVKHAKTVAERDQANNKLTAVVELFDASPPSDRGLPDWGQAEALAWLGQSHIQRGDKVAARNTLERALVIAPDYVWAHALQTQLKSPR